MSLPSAGGKGDGHCDCSIHSQWGWDSSRGSPAGTPRELTLCGGVARLQSGDEQAPYGGMGDRFVSRDMRAMHAQHFESANEMPQNQHLSIATARLFLCEDFAFDFQLWTPGSD